LEPQTSLALVALGTAMLVAFDMAFDIPHLIFAYLLPILFVARRFGQFEALTATAVYSVIAAFFFYAPRFSFYVDDVTDFVELTSFCVLALLVIQFFARQRCTQLL
jgi:K+-sensing histidine kinase KdpD